jgi:allantoinase
VTRFDLVIHDGMVLTPGGEVAADVGVSDGSIVAIEPGIDRNAPVTIDASGRIVFPGAVDPHVHFNEPGRTDWEGWATGSGALVAGGVTTAIEMPLNAHPPTLDAASFEAKSTAAASQSWADFALWGGLTPDNLDSLDELHEAGVAGLKAFMSTSGTDDFRHADDATLYHGMRFAASVGLPVAVHAENDAITADLARRARAEGRAAMPDYLASRPVVAELEAIGRAIAIAEETGCALHIVHVSTGRGVALVSEARARGVDVTCETCPHYLVFSEDDAERIGALAKCAPPLRDEATRDALRAQVARGAVEMIASDHSPAPPSMKTGDDYFAIWGGISGCQHLVPVTVTVGHEMGLDWPHLARLLAGAAAERFGLGRKGTIAIGFDADIAILAPQDPAPIPTSDVRYRHPASAWDGVPVSYRVTHTILRGTVVHGEGALRSAAPGGRLVRPSRR